MERRRGEQAKHGRRGKESDGGRMEVGRRDDEEEGSRGIKVHRFPVSLGHAHENFNQALQITASCLSQHMH